MDGLEHSAQSRNPNAFCDAVQGVADAVMGMIQAATQSAYLVGAGQPCNEPGKAPRLTESEMKQIEEDTNCLYRNLEEVIQKAPMYPNNPERVNQVCIADEVFSCITNSLSIY